MKQKTNMFTTLVRKIGNRVVSSMTLISLMASMFLTGLISAHAQSWNGGTPPSDIVFRVAHVSGWNASALCADFKMNYTNPTVLEVVWWTESGSKKYGWGELSQTIATGNVFTSCIHPRFINPSLPLANPKITISVKLAGRSWENEWGSASAVWSGPSQTVSSSSQTGVSMGGEGSTDWNKVTTQTTKPQSPYAIEYIPKLMGNLDVKITQPTTGLNCEASIYIEGSTVPYRSGDCDILGNVTFGGLYEQSKYFVAARNKDITGNYSDYKTTPLFTYTSGELAATKTPIATVTPPVVKPKLDYPQIGKGMIDPSDSNKASSKITFPVSNLSDSDLWAIRVFPADDVSKSLTGAFLNTPLGLGKNVKEATIGGIEKGKSYTLWAVLVKRVTNPDSQSPNWADWPDWSEVQYFSINGDAKVLEAKNAVSSTSQPTTSSSIRFSETIKLDNGNKKVVWSGGNPPYRVQLINSTTKSSFGTVPQNGFSHEIAANASANYTVLVCSESDWDKVSDKCPANSASKDLSAADNTWYERAMSMGVQLYTTSPDGVTTALPMEAYKTWDLSNPVLRDQINKLYNDGPSIYKLGNTLTASSPGTTKVTLSWQAKNFKGTPYDTECIGKEANMKYFIAWNEIAGDVPTTAEYETLKSYAAGENYSTKKVVIPTTNTTTVAATKPEDSNLFYAPAPGGTYNVVVGGLKPNKRYIMGVVPSCSGASYGNDSISNIVPVQTLSDGAVSVAVVQRPAAPKNARIGELRNSKGVYMMLWDGADSNKTYSIFMEKDGKPWILGYSYQRIRPVLTSDIIGETSAVLSIGITGLSANTNYKLGIAEDPESGVRSEISWVQPFTTPVYNPPETLPAGYDTKAVPLNGFDFNPDTGVLNLKWRNLDIPNIDGYEIVETSQTTGQSFNRIITSVPDQRAYEYGFSLTRQKWDVNYTFKIRALYHVYKRDASGLVVVTNGSAEWEDKQGPWASWDTINYPIIPEVYVPAEDKPVRSGCTIDYDLGVVGENQTRNATTISLTELKPIEFKLQPPRSGLNPTESYFYRVYDDSGKDVSGQCSVSRLNSRPNMTAMSDPSIRDIADYNALSNDPSTGCKLYKEPGYPDKAICMSFAEYDSKYNTYKLFTGDPQIVARRTAFNTANKALWLQKNISTPAPCSITINPTASKTYTLQGFIRDEVIADMGRDPMQGVCVAKASNPVRVNLNLPKEPEIVSFKLVPTNSTDELNQLRTQGYIPGGNATLSIKIEDTSPSTVDQLASCELKDDAGKSYEINPTLCVRGKTIQVPTKLEGAGKKIMTLKVTNIFGKSSQKTLEVYNDLNKTIPLVSNLPAAPLDVNQVVKLDAVCDSNGSECVQTDYYVATSAVNSCEAIADVGYTQCPGNGTCSFPVYAKDSSLEQTVCVRTLNKSGIYSYSAPNKVQFKLRPPAIIPAPAPAASIDPIVPVDNKPLSGKVITATSNDSTSAVQEFGKDAKIFVNYVVKNNTNTEQKLDFNSGTQTKYTIKQLTNGSIVRVSTDGIMSTQALQTITIPANSSKVIGSYLWDGKNSTNNFVYGKFEVSAEVLATNITFSPSVYTFEVKEVLTTAVDQAVSINQSQTVMAPSELSGNAVWEPNTTVTNGRSINVKLSVVSQEESVSYKLKRNGVEVKSGTISKASYAVPNNVSNVDLELNKLNIFTITLTSVSGKTFDVPTKAIVQDATAPEVKNIMQQITPDKKLKWNFEVTDTLGSPMAKVKAIVRNTETGEKVVKDLTLNAQGKYEVIVDGAQLNFRPGSKYVLDVISEDALGNGKDNAISSTQLQLSQTEKDMLNPLYKGLDIVSSLSGDTTKVSIKAGNAINFVANDVPKGSKIIMEDIMLRGVNQVNNQKMVRLPAGKYKITLESTGGVTQTIDYTIDPYYYDPLGDINGDGSAGGLDDYALYQKGKAANVYNSIDSSLVAESKAIGDKILAQLNVNAKLFFKN